MVIQLIKKKFGYTETVHVVISTTVVEEGSTAAIASEWTFWNQSCIISLLLTSDMTCLRRKTDSSLIHFVGSESMAGLLFPRVGRCAVSAAVWRHSRR